MRLQSRKADLGCVCFKVLDESANAFKAVPDSAQRRVAGETQKAADLSGLVAMIDVQRHGYGSANCASVPLCGMQLSVCFDRQPVALSQRLRANLGWCASLVRVCAQAFSLLLSSTAVALAAPTIAVAGANSELTVRQYAAACAACFNFESHEANTLSLIGQRLACVGSALRASLFSPVHLYSARV